MMAWTWVWQPLTVAVLAYCIGMDDETDNSPAASSLFGMDMLWMGYVD